jgi:homoserine dehydrogenase
VVQTGRKAGEAVPVVIVTHEAREMDVRKALHKIDNMEITREKTNLIRIEEMLE